MEKQGERPPAVWNATYVPREEGACLSGLFRQQAARTPLALALKDGDDELSYAQLDAASQALAARLSAAGATPGSRIGIGLHRSAPAIVAVLAILAIGAAYVPLDPSYPAERLAYQAKDAGLRHLISSRALADQWSSMTDARLVVIDYASGESMAFPASLSGAVAADLAYVIYTSGSTGQPKGVQIEHRSAINFVRWVQSALGIGPGDRVLAQASLSFDMSVLDIFATLTGGATLVLAPQESALNGREMCRLIAECGATWMQATPSTWRLLVEAGLPATPTLSAMVGGEALGEDLAEALRERLGAVWNLYGPTETTVYSSAARYEGGRPLIGRPIANTQLHVLDASGAPAAVAEVGELHIGGVGLSRGYLNQPERTAQAFVVASHPTLAGARLYKTGDLARWTPGGQLEYLGRNDHQVKVRGFRIELGEIESVLSAAPEVACCAVIARPDHVGVHRLIAYAVPSTPGATIDTDLLKAHLRRRLPEYMVPSTIVTLAVLPLTPNQKVDRNALPDPQALLLHGTEAPDDLLDPEEEVIADVWSKVLGVPIRSRNADFFEWGGHSLLALNTIMGLEEVFNRALPLDSLWADGCTVGGMARIVRLLRNEPELSRLVHIRPGRNDRSPLFVIHTARGSVNEYFALAHEMSDDHPVIGVRARGVYGETTPTRTIEGLATDCIEAMREYQPKGPYMVAGFSLGGLIAFEVASQLERAGESVRFLGMFDTVAPGFTPHPPLQERLHWWLSRLRSLVLRGAAKPEVAGKDPQLDERATVSPIAAGLQRALLESIHGYRPSAPYRGKVDLFVVRNTARQSREPTLGWRTWWSGDYKSHLLSSEGHLDIMSEAGAPELAQAVGTAIQH